MFLPTTLTHTHDPLPTTFSYTHVVAVLYAPVLLLILTHLPYLLVGAAWIFFFQYPRKFARRGSENSWKLLNLKVKNWERVVGVKLSKKNNKQTKKAYVHEVGDPGLEGYFSFVLCPTERENKKNQPH